MSNIQFPLSTPVLIYDGDCGLCKQWVARFRKVTRDRVEYVASQEVGERFAQISHEQLLASVWLIEPSGRISGAAEAVFRTLATSWWWKWLPLFYIALPGFALLSEWIYRWVADHRSTQCSIHQ